MWTREQILKEPFFGDQRTEVLVLLDTVETTQEEAREKLAVLGEILQKPLPYNQRVEQALDFLKED